MEKVEPLNIDAHCGRCNHRYKVFNPVVFNIKTIICPNCGLLYTRVGNQWLAVEEETMRKNDKLNKYLQLGDKSCMKKQD